MLKPRYVDVITYTPNKGTVAAWLAQNMPEHTYYADEENKKDIKLKANKSKTYSSGNHSISCIRCLPHEVQEATEDQEEGWVRKLPFEILAIGHCRYKTWDNGVMTDHCPWNALRNDPELLAKKEKAHLREYVDENGDIQLEPFIPELLV